MFGRIAFFDLQSGDFIGIQGHSMQVKKVNCVIFLNDEFGLSTCDEIVITAAAEPNVKLWDPSQGMHFDA